MPAKSEAALAQKKRRNAERDVEKRQSYREAKESTILLNLDKKFTVTKDTDLKIFDNILHTEVGEDLSTSYLYSCSGGKRRLSNSAHARLNIISHNLKMRSSASTMAIVENYASCNEDD